MYPVSEAFKTAIKKAQRVEHIRGTVGSVSFDDSNIASLTYSNRCSDTSDVTFGSAYIGQIEVTFIGLSIARGAWRGQTITLEYGLTLADDSVEWIPSGVYTIASAEWTDIGIAITAYDCLAKLDIPAQITNTVGTPYGMLSLIASETGVTLGITQGEVEALPNGTENVTLASPNDITTYRDFVSWIASMVGGFATATMEGELTIRSFADSEVVDQFSDRHRIQGSVFSDYSTDYSGITIQDKDNGLQYYYAGGDGAYISVGSNPLLQADLQATRDRQRQALADVAHGITYTPFTIQLNNCPVYDLGDLLELSGGIAGEDTLTCCIMSIEWTFKNTISLQGYGADPNLTAGKSKTDKALSSIKKQTQDQGLTYYTFTNSEEIEINDYEQTTLIDVEFAVNNPTTVMMFHEIKMLNDIIDDSQTVTLYFYHGDDLINYQPADTYSEDDEYHFFPSFYTLLNVQNGVTQRWRVKAQTSSGTATVDIGDVQATLVGQKMVAEDAFKGTIHVEDLYSPIMRGRIIGSLTDDMSPADNPVISGPIPPVTDNALINENGDFIVTENGDFIVKE
ncbi:MAG: hypothetical protein J6U23_02275 [Clostridiales bacterium]|nr:hypothetical protein [Clostridiales bacterium]